MKKLYTILPFLLIANFAFSQITYEQDCEDFCADVLECLPVDCDSTKVYYYDFDPGIREQIWSETNAVAQTDVYEIFSGAPDNTSYGTPSHVNGAPNIDIIVPTWRNTTNNDPNNGPDQFRYIGYFYAPQDNMVLSDDSGQSGERFRVWIGDCFSAGKVIYESPYGDDSPFIGGVGNGIGNFYTVNKGWHLLIVEGTDNAAFAGFFLRLNGVNYTGPLSYEKPQLICKVVGCDYVLGEDEFDCIPNDCQPSAILPNSGGEDTGDPTSIVIDRCAGDFEIGTGRTGWWNGWTAITQNANVPNTLLDWVDVSNSVTSPECITDATINVDFGNHIIFSRRIRGYVWIDYRLLINGIAGWTKTYHEYLYEDERNDTNPDVLPPPQYQTKGGSGHGYRLNIPPSSVLQVQARVRYQAVAFQPSSYFRYIGGLRSEANFSFNPIEEVEDISTLRSAPFWILPEEQGYTFGEGEPIPGAKILGSEKELLKAVEEQEKIVLKEREKFESEIEELINNIDR